MSRKRKHEDPVDVMPVAESWSRTEQYTVKGRHQWTIDNFLHRAQFTEVGDSLCSPIFRIPVDEFRSNKPQELQFQLEVFPNGEEGEDNCDYVAVFLTSRLQGDLDVKYDFSVLKSDNTCWGRIGNTFKKFCPDQNSWGYGKAFSKAKLMEKQNELLPNGCLTIVCNLEIFYSDKTTQGKKRPRLDFSPPPEHNVKLGDQLSEAFSGGQFSDVTLVCEEKMFPCHKVILSARSDVFKAMFSHENTKEGQTNQVDITDTDPDTLEQLLKYIYSDKLDCDMPNLASSLMRAADKYNIPRLKSLCEEAICNNIEVSNAADILVLAHMYEATNLKAMAVDFIMNNLNKVSETTAWTNITTGQHPKLLGEMFKTLMERLKSITSPSIPT